ncbi:MAG: PAS domain S-box protein [Syntrophales bacterium]|jgi:PAS domain S-box-containing protein|nr:PAS domain S-box protein [Syntrophales bacterium]
MEKRLSILMISLSEDDTELVSRRFQEAGYAIVHQRAEDADQTRQALASRSWEFVIADSPSALVILRQTGSDIPYLVVSDESDVETAIAAMKAGIDDYILKSNLLRLVSAFEQALEKAAIRRQQREAEEKSRQTAQEKEALCLTMTLKTSSGIAILQQGKLVFVNPYLIKDYGYKEEDFLGKTMLEFIHPEDRAKVRQNAIAMLKGKSATPYRYRVVCADGQIRWVVESLATISYGGSPAIMGNIIDVTEMTQLERQLEDARALLIKEEKLSSLGMLAVGISHEILNPLNIISLNIQLLEINEWPPEKTKEMLAVISRQVERIEKIVRDLNMFAKPSQGEFIPVDVNKLIESVFTLINPKLRLARINLEKELGADLPAISLEQNKMWQVFMNLITNAIDAMAEKEEKTLRAATSRETTKEGEFVRIVFADTGKGIEKENSSKIFDPFFTTKAPGAGTGLGLSIAYSVIQEHKGSIVVENNKEGGASFIIRLPVKHS